MSEHRDLQQEAIDLDAEGQRALLSGQAVPARDAFRAAADRYRASWEAAPADAFGRLVGMVKSAVLAGEGETPARYVHSAVGDSPSSPTAAYALALAALVHGDDALAGRAAGVMREGGEPFERAAEAIEALAVADADRYRAALEAIVEDFAARDAHLTGVAIADTAVVLERLAASRGIAAQLSSPLVPGT